MASEIIVQSDMSYKAAADLSTHQYKCMKGSGARGCTIVSAATDPVVGILINLPVANGAAQVRRGGVVKALADGSGTAIVAQDWVGPNASGILVKKTAANANVIGRAQEACTVANQIISVLWVDNAGLDALSS